MDDCTELKRLLIRRDRWIELYQNMELTKNRDLAESAAYTDLLVKRAQVPFTGYVLRQGAVVISGEARDMLADEALDVFLAEFEQDLTLRGFRLMAVAERRQEHQGTDTAHERRRNGS